jgi:hypothetical protein
VVEWKIAVAGWPGAVNLVWPETAGNGCALVIWRTKKSEDSFDTGLNISVNGRRFYRWHHLLVGVKEAELYL